MSVKLQIEIEISNTNEEALNNLRNPTEFNKELLIFSIEYGLQLDQFNPLNSNTKWTTKVIAIKKEVIL